MNSNAGYALLIGVDDYTSHGEASSLKGSRESVLSLYSFARVLLGLPPENIRVLASPPFKGSEFYGVPTPPPPDMMGEARLPAIQGGLAWLADKLAQDPTAAGLLTFAGHGSFSKDKGSLLCPSDIGADLANAIAVRDLAKHDGLQKVRDRLTVVLDCCHFVEEKASSDLQAPTALSHDASADEVAEDWGSFDISDRVLLASRLGQPAYQALLGKVHRGALTFALVTVAEQWKRCDEPGGSGMDISNKQLHKRIRKLLSALGIRQNVQLRVPESSMSKRKEVRKMPFFGTHAGPTSRKPDAPRDNVQLDPNQADYTLYTLTLTYTNNGRQGSQTAYALSVGKTGTGVQSAYTAGTEYWAVPKAFTDALNNTNNTGKEITFAATTGSWPSLPTAWTNNGSSSSPSMSSSPTWSKVTGDMSQTILYAAPSYGLAISGTDSTLKVTWYRPEPSTYVVNSTGATFSSSTSLTVVGGWSRSQNS